MMINKTQTKTHLALYLSAALVSSIQTLDAAISRVESDEITRQLNLAPLKKLKKTVENTTSETDSAHEESDENDPLEVINRGFFGLNQVLDNLILKPLAYLFTNLLPDPIITGVDNMLTNLFTPFYAVNFFLQGQGDLGAKAIGRFFVNTTVGVAGLFDVGNEIELANTPTSFNETLTTWGAGRGFYIMLPIFGPTTTRGAIGKVGDYVTNPVNMYLNHTSENKNTKKVISYSIMGLDMINRRRKLMPVTDMLERESLDLYATLRSVYFQKEQEMEYEIAERGKAAE